MLQGYGARMSLIDRYLVRRIGVMMLFVACVLVLALSLERLLRLIDEVTTSGAPIPQAFLLLGYLQPHYLGLTIPAALFLGTMLAVRRLHEQSEMVIFHASGRSLMRLLIPILVLAAAMAALVLVLVAVAQPYSRYAFRAEYHHLRQTQQQVQLRPHAFQRLSDRLVLRIEAVEQENPVRIRGFFSAAQEKSGGRTLISADRASVEQQPGVPLTLRLYEGSIIREAADGTSDLVRFNEYVWRPTLDAGLPYGPRGTDKRELTLPELWRGGVPGVTLADSDAERRAELHLRLVEVFSVPLLALLAIPLSLIGGNRGGKAYGIGLGIVVLVLYEKLLGFGEALAASGKISPLLSLWGPWLMMGTVTFGLLCYRNFFPYSATLFAKKMSPP